MKKETRKRVRKYILFGIAICLLLYGIKFTVFGNLPNHRRNTELLQSVISPDGTRTVEVYRYNGGATVCFSVLCKVSGAGIPDRPIFWLYHAEDATVSWQNEDSVRIEPARFDADCDLKEALSLDVRSEWYDFRKGLGGFGRDEDGRIFLHRWWR